MIVQTLEFLSLFWLNGLICCHITNVPFHQCCQFLDACIGGRLWKNNVIKTRRLSTIGTWPTGDIMASRNGSENRLLKRAGAGLHSEHRSASVHSSERNSGRHNLTSADGPLCWPLFSPSLPGIPLNTIPHRFYQIFQSSKLSFFNICFSIISQNSLSFWDWAL